MRAVQQAHAGAQSTVHDPAASPCTLARSLTRTSNWLPLRFTNATSLSMMPFRSSGGGAGPAPAAASASSPAPASASGPESDSAPDSDSDSAPDSVPAAASSPAAASVPASAAASSPAAASPASPDAGAPARRAATGVLASSGCESSLTLLYMRSSSSPLGCDCGWLAAPPSAAAASSSATSSSSCPSPSSCPSLTAPGGEGCCCGCWG